MKTMRRVDPVYMGLAERLGECSTSILIIAFYGCLRPLSPVLILVRSNISAGSMCALTAVLCLMLIVSSSLLPPGRHVNHGLLRSITGSPVAPTQPIDFPPGSEQLWPDAPCALRFGRTGGMEGVLGRVWEFTDWNWQKSVFGDSDQGFGGALKQNAVSRVNSQLHAHVEPDLMLTAL